MAREEFNLDGFYKLHGQHQFIQGTIPLFVDKVTDIEKVVEEWGYFEGKLICPRKRNADILIRGRIKRVGDVSSLDFFTYKKDSCFADRYFGLSQDESSSLEGNYTGVWRTLPTGIVDLTRDVPSMLDAMKVNPLKNQLFVAGFNLTKN